MAYGDQPGARRAPRRRSPAKPKPPTKRQVQSSRQQARGYQSQGQSVQRQANQQRAAAQRKARRTFTPIPTLGAVPGQQKIKQARRVQERAERSIRGSIPRPAIPSLAHMTPAQRATALRLGARSNAQARRRGVTPAELARAREFDPVVRARDAAIRSAQQQATQKVYAQLARRTLNRKVSVPVLALNGGRGMLRPEGSRQVKALQGVPEKVQAQIGSMIAEQMRGQVKPGRPHKRVGIGPASIDATAATRLAQAAAQSITSGHGGALRKGFAPNAVKDLVGFPAGAVKGIYEMGAATVEAAHGDTKRAVRIAKGMTEGSLGRLVQGDVKGAVAQLEEHPLYSALDYAGAYGLAGRGAGAVARAGLAGSKARRAAQLDRADAVAFRGARMGIKRSGSKNLFTRAVQQRQDARAPKDYRGRVVMQESALPFRGRSHQIERAVDEFASTENSRLNLQRDRLARDTERIPVRRGQNVPGRRGAVVRRVDRAVGRPKVTIRGRRITRRPERVVPRLIAEREVRFNPRSKNAALRDPQVLVDDLRKIRAEIDAEYRNPDTYASMTRGQRDTNRENVAALDAVLRKPDVLHQYAGELWRASQAIGREAGTNTRMLVHLKALDPQQADIAARRPYGVRHEGGRPVDKAILPGDVAAHQAVKAVAGKAAVRARKAREATARARDGAVRAQERVQMDTTPLGPRGSTFDPRALRERVNALEEKAFTLRERGDHAGAKVLDEQIRGLHEQMDRIRSGEAVTGAHDRAVHEVTWYHGTPQRFEGLPTAKGQWSDLGVYMTSDPGYAAGYAGAGEGARTVMGRVAVKPERTLDTRAGVTFDRVGMLRVAETLRDDAMRAIPGFVKKNGHGASAANLRAVVQREVDAVRRMLGRGKTIDPEAAGAIQQRLMDLSEKVGGWRGESGTGNRNQALARAIRKSGFDVVRKIDRTADSIVVVNERVMRSPHFRREDAAAARRAVVAKRETRKAADKAARQARKAATQAKPKPYRGLVDQSGARLTPAQVKARMEAAGIEAPAFLTQAPGSRGARAFYQSALAHGRKSAGSQGRRSGRSTLLGAHPYGEQGVTEALMHGRILGTTIQSFDNFIGQFAVKGPNGIRLTPTEAERIADNVDSADMPKLVPIRLAPAKLGDQVVAAISDLQGSGNLPPLKDLMENVLAERVLDVSMLPKESQNVALVPEVALNRWKSHELDRAADFQKAGQAVTGAFRKTVLPFSLKWLFGNLAEATVRTAVAGVFLPRDIPIARRIMRETYKLDAQKADTFLARTQQGTLFGAPTRSIYRDASMFKGSNWQKVGAGFGAFGRAPVAREILAGLDLYQRGVFALNKGLERLYQQGVIGKTARLEIEEMTGSWVKAIRASDSALADVARGLLNTESQVRYARAIDEVLGKYTRFSPSVRKVTQGLAPFLPWYMAAVRFVYHTLPAKHPVKTALLTNTERTFEDDWKLQIQQTGSAKIINKGNLKAGLILSDGGILSLDRYAPFGAMTDLPANVLDPILPQLMSVYNIANGRNFAGRDLQAADGQPISGGKQTWMAIYAGLESLLPGLQLARRAMEHGETSFDDSTIFSPKSKPGTQHASSLDIPGLPAGLNRIFDPLRPTYLRKGSPVNVDSGPSRPPKLTPEQEIQREMSRSSADPKLQRDMLEIQKALAGG